jgi:hypothetical protein
MKYILVSLFLLYTLQACHTRPDFDAEKKAILAIHNDQQKAHLEKNVALLLGDSSSDYIEVNRGLVKKPTYTENFKRFKAYFETVEFVAWEDISPPIISISDDATMATSVVEKVVVTRAKSEDHKLDTTHYAWLAVFKKINGKWQLHRMASTNK